MLLAILLRHLTTDTCPEELRRYAALRLLIGAAEIADALQQANGGRKEYQDADGTVTRVAEWFGYKARCRSAGRCGTPATRRSEAR